MSDLKFETTTKLKSLDKHQDNNTNNKSSSYNNRPLFLVKQNQENNERPEKNFITKEDLNTNHSNNTTNENISQDKANLSKEIINEKEETMIIEKKEKENNQIQKITKEFNTNIESKIIKPSINHPFIMNNNHIENNLMFQRNNVLNNNSYNNNQGNNPNITNNNNNEQNHKFITESPQNKRSLRGHSVKPSIHHLLEDAIIKKEFQEPKRKVVLKNDLPPSYGMVGANDPSKSFQKIINIDESDSFIEEENESDFSQDFEEDDDEDDEEYNISNNNINWLNRRKKDKVNSLYNNFPKRKEYDNPICAELSDIIKKYGFDKVIESIYQNRTEKLNNKEVNNSPIKNNDPTEPKEN